MPKYEMHIHTAECDLVAQVSGKEMVHLYQDAGYDGMVVTDHYFNIFYDWFAEEVAGASHQKIIDRWLKGYYAARNEGEKIGFTVLPGAEVRFDGTINDYLVYGVTEDFFYHAPLLNRLKNVKELLEVLPQEVCVVQAHPFRENMTVCDPSPLFGIEIYNGGTEKFRNELAKIYAEHYGKAMTSGSDFHGKNALARGGIITPEPIQTPQDLIQTLRSGNYETIHTY